jgi:hypothetical protein
MNRKVALAPLIIVLAMIMFAPLIKAAPPISIAPGIPVPADIPNITIPHDSPGQVLASSSFGDISYTIDSSINVPVVTCTLNLPRAGWVLVTSNASVTRLVDPYVAHFRLKIDGTEDADTDRFVSVEDDYYQQTSVLAISVMRWQEAGLHTYSLVTARTSGTGTIKLFDPTISAIYFPQGGVVQPTEPQVGVYQYISNTLLVITSTQFTNIEPGLLYLSTDTYAKVFNFPYRVNVCTSVDNASSCTGRVAHSVDITDTVTGHNQTALAATQLSVLAPGAHTLRVLGARTSGTGTVWLSDVNLLGVYIPGSNSFMTATTKSMTGVYTLPVETTYRTIVSVTIDVPQDSWVFMAADTTAYAGTGGTSVVMLRLAIDNTTGLASTDRSAGVVDGISRYQTMADSLVYPVKAGRHTIRLLAKVFLGGDTAYLLNPSLTVFIPGMQMPLPLVLKN